jgi:hypothetical protein
MYIYQSLFLCGKKAFLSHYRKLDVAKKDVGGGGRGECHPKTEQEPFEIFFRKTDIHLSRKKVS